MYYCNSRYYNPEWGRWISPDDIEYLNPESVNGLNLYCYCFNNPIMYKDSSGHYPEGVVPSDNIFGWRNKDGSWSLYDNDRFEDYTPFHEQLFAINWSGFKLKDNMFGGTVSFTLITGGWEWKHLDLSLLDFGHAELGFEIGANGVSASAFASIYSPSVSFDLFGITIEISFEVGAAGFDFKYNKEEKYFKSKFAGGFGAGISIDW